MAGGTFTAHNKIRPGAYINFKAVSAPQSSIGTRGIVTIPIPMSWGGGVTELLSTDLVDGSSLAKIGYTATDEEAQVVREALKNAYKAIIYRLDAGGTRAVGVLAPLTATAKYAGVLGNRITVSIVENGDKFDVKTGFKGAEKDSQTVSTVGELKSNDYVTFSGTGALVANAGVTLEGGENGTIESANYTNYLGAIESYNWDTMGIPQEVDSAVNGAVVTFIKSMRDDKGRKVQAVLYNASADYEGIITTSQGYTTADEVVAPPTFVAYVAGLTAGSAANVSNTYHQINGAESIVYPEGVEPYKHDDIIERLKRGEFILSTRQDGAVVIEQDINTLHTYPADKGYAFSKNRVIRTLDEINNSLALLFERSYIGKINNDYEGRNIFKSAIISYLNTLESIGAIQNFDSQEDVKIFAGEAIDSVVVDMAVQPVDSVEKLYLTVMVG